MHSNRKEREIRSRTKTISNLKKWLEKEEKGLKEALEKPMTESEYLFTKWEKEFPGQLKKIGGKRRKQKGFFTFEGVEFEYIFQTAQHYPGTLHIRSWVKIIRKGTFAFAYIQLAEDLHACLNRLVDWKQEEPDVLDIYNDTFEFQSFKKETEEADKKLVGKNNNIKQYGNLNTTYF